MSRTLKKCLDSLNIEANIFEQCITLQEEFAAIKKVYFKLALKNHPDKGGDIDVFREVQENFEILRKLFEEEKISSFAPYRAKPEEAEQTYAQGEYSDGAGVQSWDFFASAADEIIPPYKVERSKTKRGKCSRKGTSKQPVPHEEENFYPGEMKFGSFNAELGSYWCWVHLCCWRVPHKIWRGLPDPNTCGDRSLFHKRLAAMNEVLLCGFNTLPAKDQEAIVSFVMNQDHWAKETKKKSAATAEPHEEAAATGESQAKDENNASSSSSGVKAGGGDVAVKEDRLLSSVKEMFVVPRPGVGKCKPHALAGKKVVLTGVFPEIGGGAGLSLGKDRMKLLIESFGGQVTGSISGKTDYVIYGKEPGFGKVDAAKRRKLPMMTLHDLKMGLEEGLMIEDVKPSAAGPTSGFSTGFKHNSVAPAGLQVHKVEDKKEQVVKAAKIPKEKKAKVPKAKATKKRARDEDGEDGDDAEKGDHEEDSMGEAIKEEDTLVKVKGTKAPKVPRKSRSEINLDNKAVQLAKREMRIQLEEEKRAKTEARKKAKEEAGKGGKKAVPKKKKVKQEETIITCDSCGEDCSPSSWVVGEEDVCDACYTTNHLHTGGRAQAFGEFVEAA